ncbi:MAG: tetratricopeptide repeat protein [Acidobacteriia bacterium]|nr:tetratricopeptide repeat protein [Terriglobia bacterium]
MPYTRSAWRISIRMFWFASVAFSGATLAAQPNVAASLNDQGLAAAERGDYARAEPLYAESVQKWRALGSPYDAHTAATLVNLGQVLCNEGKWREGINALEEALALHRRSLGSKHSRTIYNLCQLGHAYALSGDLDRAEGALAEALATEKELYAGDVLLGHTLLAMSLLRRLQGRLDESLQFGEEGLNAALKAEGELNTAAGMAYENVAAIHRLAGRPERALPLFRKARFIYRQTIGSSSPVFFSLLIQEGLALLDEGELTLAEQDMSQAVDALAKMGPACEYRLATAESNLGLLRLRQRKFAEAERLLTHALSIEERLPSRPVFDMAATMEILAQLRKAQRRDAESAQLRSRAADLHTGR